MEAIASCVNQVIERTNLSEEGFHGPFVRDVNRMAFYLSCDGPHGFLNSLGVAGTDKDIGSLRCRLLCDGQPDALRTTQNNHPFVLETVS